MKHETLADVTVVIPTFNRGSFTVRALNSVLNQSCHPQQIIVVDDASSDDTVAVVRRWASDKNLRLHVESMAKNGGPAAARNRGIELATTEYVAFLDSDDEHLPHTLVRLRAAFETYPDAVLSFGDATIVTPPDRQEHAIFRTQFDVIHDGVLENAKDALLRASIIPTSATCFRRDAAMAVGCMPNVRIAEDWLFWLRLSERGRFVFTLDDLALNYRHDSNISAEGDHQSHGKLMGFEALLDGSMGVSLNERQRSAVMGWHAEQLIGWHYWLSKRGLGAFLRGIEGSVWKTLASEPKCFARATAASLLKARR